MTDRADYTRELEAHIEHLAGELVAAWQAVGDAKERALDAACRLEESRVTVADRRRPRTAREGAAVMPRKPTRKDFVMLTDVRNRLVESLRRFDLYPNRGIDHPYQPNPYYTPDRRLQNRPVNCRHDVPWTECTVCSRPVSP